MKLIYLLLCFICIAYGSTKDKYLKELNRLTDEQKEVLHKVYEYGQQHNLGLELATIAWKESNFGLWLINLSDGKYGSFGIFHIRLDYALDRKKLKGDWNASRYAEELLTDFEVSINEAIAIFNMFKNYRKKSSNRLRDTFASYNGGYKLTKQAIAYGDDSLVRKAALEQYFKNKQMTLTQKKEKQCDIY